jgi:hypothetical protein
MQPASCVTRRAAEFRGNAVSPRAVSHRNCAGRFDPQPGESYSDGIIRKSGIGQSRRRQGLALARSSPNDDRGCKSLAFGSK